MKPTNIMCLVVCLLALPPAARADWQAWTTNQTRRVLRDGNPEKQPFVHLQAARNETESFQILIRSDVPIKGITIEPYDLVSPDGAIIRADNARLYRQHQLELTIPTYRNDAFKPGWYPDALIPFKHPLTGQPLKGPRFSAVPFDLPANETHGFWIDIHIPENATPGEYRGSYNLVMGLGGPSISKSAVPITLTVWDFALPRVSTLRTAFGSPAPRLRGYYAKRAKDGKEPEPTDWPAVEAQCAQFLTEHRINAYPPSALLAPQAQPDGSYRLSSEQIRSLRDFIDRYHVNAIETPHPRIVIKDPDAEKAKLHAWLKSYDLAATELNRPGIDFYTYLIDEPNEEPAYRYVQKWGKAIREAKSIVKVMTTEQTTTQNPAWGDLYGAVDIWCPLFPLFEAENAAARQAQGETIWAYTALCQRDPTPWWHIDYPLLNYRVPSWIAWRYRIRGLLYWGGMVYWNQVDDPWTDPKTYDRRQNGKGPLWNGEGTTMYPARAVGYDGLVPSLRLKALRDSIEDYEYLSILERASRTADAERIVLLLASSWFNWNKDPVAYQKAREQLANLILQSARR